MKKIIILFIFLFSFFYFFQSNANFSDDIKKLIERGHEEVIYCREDSCSLDKGVKLVGSQLDDNIVKNRKASQYIQDVVMYLLTFVTIIAVIYIIYAGFLILTSAGDEEKRKTQKRVILSVAIGIALIWLSVPIVKFIMNVLIAS